MFEDDCCVLARVFGWRWFGRSNVGRAELRYRWGVHVFYRTTLYDGNPDKE